jgi:hypothetical protein
MLLGKHCGSIGSAIFDKGLVVLMYFATVLALPSLWKGCICACRALH